MRDFLLAPPSRLSEGTDRDVVVSVKVRYLRNLEGYSFPPRSSGTDSAALRERVLEAFAEGGGADSLLLLRMEDAEAAEAEALAERGYVDAGEADDSNGVFGRALALFDAGRESCFVNGGDHLRLCVQRSGFSVSEAFDRAKAWDTALDERLRFAASFEYGYLTSHPEDCGSGLRLSARTFLPGIVSSGVFDRVARDLLASDIEPRQDGDSFVILSSRAPLGVDEEAFVRRFEGVLTTLAEGERKTRERVLSRDRLLLEDAAYRAAAILRAARLLPFDEAGKLLSRLRAGVAYGIVPRSDGDPFAPIDASLLLSAPGHVKLVLGEKNSIDADAARCRLVRALLPHYLMEPF